MLVSKKMNVFSLLSGKPRSTSSAKDNGLSTAQDLDNLNLGESDYRINITKHEDFYKTNTAQMVNPLGSLNR